MTNDEITAKLQELEAKSYAHRMAIASLAHLIPHSRAALRFAANLGSDLVLASPLTDQQIEWLRQEISLLTVEPPQETGGT